MMHNREPDRTSKGHTTELFTEWAEKFIRENAITDEPFFCYLAYNAVHGPLRTSENQKASAPEAWVKKTLDRGVSFQRSDYVAILEHMDHNIGKLVDVLEELDIAENTLLVFVSDNGGCTMEDAAAGGRFPGNNGPLRGGKATTYQGGLNVPLLMNWSRYRGGQVRFSVFRSSRLAYDDPSGMIKGENLATASPAIAIPKTRRLHRPRSLSFSPPCSGRQRLGTPKSATGARWMSKKGRSDRSNLTDPTDLIESDGVDHSPLRWPTPEQATPADAV